MTPLVRAGAGAAGLRTWLPGGPRVGSLECLERRAVDDPHPARTELLSARQASRLDVFPQRGPGDVQLRGRHRDGEQLGPLLFFHAGDDTDVSLIATMIPPLHWISAQGYNDTYVSLLEGTAERFRFSSGPSPARVAIRYRRS